MKHLQRITAWLLTLLLLTALVPAAIASADEGTRGVPAAQLVANWNYGGASGSVVYANEGELFWSGKLTLASGSFGTSKSSMKTTGWNNEGQSLTFALSTKGFSGITHSAMVCASNTGPKYMTVQYSLDGVSFTDCGSFVVTNTALSADLDGLKLPAAVDDQDLVYIRWICSNRETNFKGTGAVGSGGTFNLTDCSFLGTPDGTALTVTAEPAGGRIALGDAVALSASESGSAIYYRPFSRLEDGSIDDTIPYASYDPAIGLVFDALPATVMVYAVKDETVGRIAVFSYEQIKVATPIPSEFSGGIAPNKAISLSCDTPLADIYYLLTTKAGTEDEQVGAETLYTEPLRFSEEQFPVTLVTFAKRAGCIDSETLTVEYTKKQVGGEKFYYGQLHSHTNFSDGSGTPAEAYEYAKNTAVDVDYLILTDHSNRLDEAGNLGTMDGANLGTIYEDGKTKWEIAKALAKSYTDETFVAAYGYEMTWSTAYGHINTFATEGFVSRNNSLYTGGNADGSKNGLEMYYELLTQYPASISQFNHPGTLFGYFDDFGYYSPAYDAQVCLIEVGNGQGAVRSSSYWPSYSYYDRALDKGWHLAPTNGQDNHGGSWGDSNTCRTVIWTNDFTEAGLYQALREMRTFATEDSNVSFYYEVNGEPFGSILAGDPTTLDVKVVLSDPDAGDQRGTLSIISNGGKAVYSANYDLGGGEKVFTFTLNANNDYYYARIDQVDGDIAVTAPVWAHEVNKLGIEKLSIDSSPAIAGETLALSASLYNYEQRAFAITQAVFTLTLNGQSYVVTQSGAQLAASSIAGGGSAVLQAAFTPTAVGQATLTAQITGRLGEDTLTLTSTTEFAVFASDDVLNVVIDSGHHNQYVSGEYANYLGEFTTMVETLNGRATFLTSAITDAALSNCDLLVLTVSYAGGVTYPYAAAELDAICRYAQNGGSILLCGKGDRSETGEIAAVTNQNLLLEALGSGTRFRTDTLYDNSNYGSANYQVKFTASEFLDLSSRYTAGVEQGKLEFIFHSGCSIALGEGASAIVTGGSTTKATHGSELSAAEPTDTLEGGPAVFFAAEPLKNGGTLFTTGCTFFNDYQVSNGESYAGQTTNYHLVNNILTSLLDCDSVKAARSAAEGSYCVVEGTILSNGAEHSENTAFFDTVYLMDDTGGIALFPVSGDFAVGQRVIAMGFVGSYNEDVELEKAKVFLSSNQTATPLPTLLSTQAASFRSNNGTLVHVCGVVTAISYANGRPQTIRVDDGSGEIAVFLDGYIGSESAYDLSAIAVGAKLDATGVACMGTVDDRDGAVPRIRVRDAAELVVVDSYTANTPAAWPDLWGDTDLNGKVSAADAARILRMTVKLETGSYYSRYVSDVNHSGQPDAADAALILRYTVKLEDTLG